MGCRRHRWKLWRIILQEAGVWGEAVWSSSCWRREVDAHLAKFLHRYVVNKEKMELPLCLKIVESSFRGVNSGVAGSFMQMRWICFARYLMRSMNEKAMWKNRSSWYLWEHVQHCSSPKVALFGNANDQVRDAQVNHEMSKTYVDAQGQRWPPPRRAITV